MVMKTVSIAQGNAVMKTIIIAQSTCGDEDNHYSTEYMWG